MAGLEIPGVLDSATHFDSVVARVAVGAGNQSGSYTDPAIGAGTPDGFAIGGNHLVDPIISFSGTTMSWSKNPAYAIDWIGTILITVTP